MYVAITYLILLFANHVYNFPPFFASVSTGNEFYQKVNQLLSDGDYPGARRQIINYSIL